MAKKKRGILQKLKTWHDWPQPKKLLFVVISVVTVGLLLILISHAITSTTDVEPESGTVSNACVVGDASASGGQAIQFSGSGCALAIVPQTLATQVAHTGSAYSANLTLSTGDSAIWSVVSGTLPPGMNLNGNRISGTPTQPGAYTFDVKAVFNFIGQRTKTYTILVYPPTNTGYEARQQYTLDQYVSTPWPTGDCQASITYLNAAAASLWENRNIAAINANLEKITVRSILNTACPGGTNDPGNSLWLSLFMRVYLLYNSQSSYFPGRLTAAAESHLKSVMWGYMTQFADLEKPGDIWNFSGSENLPLQRQMFYYLASQVLKDDPAYASQEDNAGRTPQQAYNQWRNFWMQKLIDLSTRGGFVEVFSPTYSGYNLGAILDIYNFAEEPILRTKAQMMLDIYWADYATDSINNVLGGGKSRAHKDRVFSGANHAIYGYANLLFGPNNVGIGNHQIHQATSGYSPPDPIVRLAQTANKGTYEFLSRRLGFGKPVNLNVTLFYYSYVTPNYIMGEAQYDGTDNYENTNSASKDDRWLGIIFDTSQDARIYPSVGDAAANHRIQNSFFSVQKFGTLLVRKNPGVDAAEPVQVYFPYILDQIVEDSGWLFVKEGNSYLAVRPQSGNYSWLSAAKNQDSDKNKRFIQLSNPNSPIIFEAATTSEFASLSAFQTRVKSQARSYSGGAMNYTDHRNNRLTLFDDNTRSQLNGSNISHNPPQFASPFLNSTSGSNIVTFTNAGKTITYDFRDTNNPFRTIR